MPILNTLVLGLTIIKLPSSASNIFHLGVRGSAINFLYNNTMIESKTEWAFLPNKVKLK